MGNRVAHLAQAKHNEEFAMLLIQPDYNDWVTTALFYAAIHYLEAYWAPGGLHSEDHKERYEILKKQFHGNTLVKVGYKTLKEGCWLARYLIKDLSSNDPAQTYFEEEHIKLFTQKLNDIKSQLRLS